MRIAAVVVTDCPGSGSLSARKFAGGDARHPPLARARDTRHPQRAGSKRNCPGVEAGAVIATYLFDALTMVSAARGAAMTTAAPSTTAAASEIQTNARSVSVAVVAIVIVRRVEILTMAASGVTAMSAAIVIPASAVRHGSRPSSSRWWPASGLHQSLAQQQQAARRRTAQQRPRLRLAVVLGSCLPLVDHHLGVMRKRARSRDVPASRCTNTLSQRIYCANEATESATRSVEETGMNTSSSQTSDRTNGYTPSSPKPRRSSVGKSPRQS